MERSGTVRVKELDSISNSVTGSRDRKCRKRHQETSAQRPLWSQTNLTLYMHWKHVMWEQVREVPHSFNYLSRRENQVKMPWKEGGPPKRSTYSCTTTPDKGVWCWKVVSEKGFFRGCQPGSPKVVADQNFVTKTTPEQIARGKPEWYMYLPLQALFSHQKGPQKFDWSLTGLSFNDYLEKGPNFINSLLDVLAAWPWKEVSFTYAKCLTKSWCIPTIKCMIINNNSNNNHLYSAISICTLNCASQKF